MTEPEREPDMRDSMDWHHDCLRFQGVLLTGVLAHWCTDWDFLPVDETTPEIMYCDCDLSDLIKRRVTG